MANRRLPQGGESREDNKRILYVDHDGPASYTTGGETILVSDIESGLSAFDFVSASGSDNSAHVCKPVFGAKGEVRSFKLLWILTGGAEVANATNLSARFCRLRIVAPS